MKKFAGVLILVLSLVFGGYMGAEVLRGFSDPALTWGYGRQINALYGLIFLMISLVGIGAGLTLIFNSIEGK